MRRVNSGARKYPMMEKIVRVRRPSEIVGQLLQKMGQLG